jgi:hypothetical protein
MRIARWAFKVLLLTPLIALLAAGSALAQDQDNSIAAAARRAQEQKKDQPKAAKVYDNDHMPTSGPINVVGQQPATGSTADNATVQIVQTKPAPTAAQVAALNSDLASAKQRLADLKADLDIAQRKYVLDQATYLSNPNNPKDKSGASALAAEKSAIDAKAAAVADAERALAAAQAKADQANKEAASAAAQEKSAQNQQSNSDQAAQPAPAQPKSTSTPDSDTATVNRN